MALGVPFLACLTLFFVVTSLFSPKKRTREETYFAKRNSLTVIKSTFKPRLRKKG